jgi:hypothetical protein
VNPAPAATRAAGAGAQRSRTSASLATAERLARIGLMVLAAMSVVVMLWWPLGYDQGIFATNGSIVVDGGLPYRDAWEARGPLAFYLFAAIEWVFGPHPWAIRLFDVAIALLTAWMLRRLMRTMVSRVTGDMVAAFWLLLVASQTYSATAQPDLWVATAVLGVVMLVAGERPYTRRDLAIAGALVGLMTLLKPFYPVYLAIPGLVALDRRRGDLLALAGDIAVLVVGWLAPIGLMLGALAMQDALRDMWEVHIGYNLRVYSGIAQPADTGRVRGVVDYLLKGKIIVASMPPIVVGLVLLWRERRATAIAMATAVAFGLFCVLLQAKFFAYHWAPLFPVFVVLGGLAFDRLLRARSDDGGGVRLFALASLAVVFLHATIRPAAYVAQWGAYMAGRQSEDQYYGAFGTGWTVDPAEQRSIARYIRSRTRPTEAIGIWPLDAALPYLAERPPVSRFTIPDVLRAPAASPLVQEYRREYMTRLATVRPRYFVIGHHSAAQGLSRPAPLRELFPELDSVLTREYRLETRIGDAEVYHRVDAAGSTPPAPARPR